MAPPVQFIPFIFTKYVCTEIDCIAVRLLKITNILAPRRLGRLRALLVAAALHGPALPPPFPHNLRPQQTRIFVQD